MKYKTYTRDTFLISLTAMSIAGMFAPERISWLQDSTILRWTVAILCGLVASYVLVRLSTSDSSLLADGNLNWQKIRSNGKGQYIEGIMIAYLKRVLFLHPLIGLLVGWILDWGVAGIIRVISAITFITICASFFGALRQWELNEKKERVDANASVSR